MKGWLDKLALSAPEFSLAGDEAVAHQDAEHGVGTALLLIMIVTVHQHLLREVRSGDNGCLTEGRLEREDAAVFSDPLRNITQRFALSVISRAQKPVARGGDNRREGSHRGFHSNLATR